MGFRIKDKLNTVFIGFATAILFPYVFFLMVYRTEYRILSQLQGQLLEGLLKSFIPSMIKSCLFANALLFFIFIWLNMNNAAKGVLIFSALAVVGLFGYSYIPKIF